MCGRMSCMLTPTSYRKICSYNDRCINKYNQPQWIDLPNNGLKFQPSDNIYPGLVTPVLLSSFHVKDTSLDRALVPMVWGMIPSWHKGDIDEQKLNTHNCRIEGIMTSKLYGEPFKASNRCVILCEGYFEWSSIKSSGTILKKQPYFFYNRNNLDNTLHNVQLWESGQWNENLGWQGPKPLLLAGIFNTWRGENTIVSDPNEDNIYSYSIITKEANNVISQIHNRMPAIISDEILLNDWLDCKRVSANRALELLGNSVADIFYQQTSINSLSKKRKTTDIQSSSSKLLKLRTESSNKKSGTLLMNWLNTGSMQNSNATNKNSTEYDI